MQMYSDWNWNGSDRIGSDRLGSDDTGRERRKRVSLQQIMELRAIYLARIGSVVYYIADRYIY